MISIRAERHFFTRLHVAANPHFKPDGPAMIESKELQSTINTLLIDEDPGAFVCTQSVLLEADDDSQLPYNLDVECIGFFRADNPKDLEEHKDTGTKIAHQILFSAVREMVLTMTGRMAWGPFSTGLARLGANEKERDKGAASPKPPKQTRPRKKVAVST